MALSSFAVFANETSISLSPEQIERELSSMWKPINEAQGTSVSRVVLGNVLWLGCTTRLEHVRNVFQRVVPKYPARVFLLEYQPENESDELAASVNAQCFLPSPGAAPVCCEVIHLSFGPAGARHVRGAVAPLLVTDVQTVLWTSLGSVPFTALADLQQHVDRTIRMASLANDPVEHLRGLLGATHPTLDLSWFRTTPLREQVTAFFDDVDLGFDLRAVRSVEIGGSQWDSLSVIVGAMFVGWLGARLGWKPSGTGAGFRFESSTGTIAVDPWVRCTNLGERSVRLFTAEGAIFGVTLDDGGMILRCNVPGRRPTERHLRIHQLSEEEALELALNTPSKARHFREAGALALPLLEYLHLTGGSGA